MTYKNGNFTWSNLIKFIIPQACCVTGMGWFGDLKMIKTWYLPSGSSQTSEGNRHLRKTLKCSWTRATVEVPQDAVDKKEASYSPGPGEQGQKEASKGDFGGVGTFIYAGF